MNIGGLNPFTLTDYPGKIAAVIFTQGCNFRCRYCHNADLIPSSSSHHQSIALEQTLGFLHQRRGLLDAVVVTGGEPTLQPDLAWYLSEIRGLGYLIKLDTNGSRPKTIRAVAACGLVDYFAMDIKAPFEKLAWLSGVTPETDCLEESIQIIASSGIEHEFRTTLVEPLLTQTDITRIKASLPKGSPHRVLPFSARHAWDPNLQNVDSSVVYTALRNPTWM